MYYNVPFRADKAMVKKIYLLVSYLREALR